MSTTAEVADQTRLDEAIASVRSDENGVQRKAWVIIGHVDNNPNLIDVMDVDSNPEASLEDFYAKLQDDQVYYCLVRVTTTVDMSTTVKFVYVHWMGEQIPVMRRARFGVVHGSVQERFNPFHLMVVTGNKEELQEEELIRMLDESSGTRNKVIEDITGRQERGFTQHSLRQKTASQPKAVAPEGLSVLVGEDVTATIAEVRDDQTPSLWTVVGYEEENIKKPLTVVAKGSGDMDELRGSLSKDQVLYCLYRVTDVIDGIKTVKFVFIMWIGEDVKHMTKAKASTHRGSVEQIFSPAHVSITTSQLSELSEVAIRDKVSSGSGSKSFVK